MLDQYLARAMQEPTVADMSIADEHMVVKRKTRISEVCSALSNNPGHAVLVLDGTKVSGIITAKDIFAKMAEGVNATKIKVEKMMRTNIMLIKGSTPLSKALDKIGETRPDAIVITEDDGSFMGYFSPEDYRDATRRLETHLLMAARIKRSKNAITETVKENKSDLLDLLLGSNEEEEEEIEVPSMISLE